MSRRKQWFFIFLVLVLVLALPVAVLANKRLYKARLSSANELHDVTGQVDAIGSAVFSMGVGGGSMQFQIQVRNLSGPPVGAHIHAPATTSETAGVVVSLCGNPAPAAIATCTFDSSTNSMTIRGEITSSLLAQWGTRPSDLLYWFDNGLAYVNVHTSLNPAGEARGQILPH